MRKGHAALWTIFSAGAFQYSQEMVEAFWLARAGSILAARLALRDVVASISAAASIHASTTITARLCEIKRDRDCGAAVFNGTEDSACHDRGLRREITATARGCVRRDPSVSLSISPVEQLPVGEAAIQQDIDLADGTGDDEYLTAGWANGYRAALENVHRG